MASTAHKSEDEIKEHFEPTSVVDQKARQTALLIKNSKHCIIFTGAGVSTSSGIPDFRGPMGVWTLREKGIRRTQPTTPILSALPTLTHMAIVKLIQTGNCKFLISQNVDGLHRRSGVPPNKIAELHGNTNLERCEKCKKEYLRDFDATADYRYSVHDHYTGRKCENCNGKLLDTIINFGEPLPKKAIQDSYEHAYKADLCIVLGSSLRVSPANEIPKIVAQRGQSLVICNLQKTPLDSFAKIHVHTKCDTFMSTVMHYLNLEIPKFILTRRVILSTFDNTLQISSVDIDGTPVTLFRKVKVEGKTILPPYKVKFKSLPEKANVKINFSFMGHYGEPDLEIEHEINKKEEVLYLLQFDPMIREWKVKKEK